MYFLSDSSKKNHIFMDQKYNGNIHPNEWVDDLQRYLFCNSNIDHFNYLDFAKSLVDSTISLPTGIDTFGKLRNALKEDISFTVFKNTNKRKLQLLKYIPEGRGGDTSKFISNFRKLCYNAEINDIEEQKKYLYKSLPMSYFDYISNEFYKKMENVNSIKELIKEFEDFIADGSHLITDESIVALKHISTGKYLSSVKNLNYTTGNQSVFVRSLEPSPTSLWRIKFDKEFSTYTDAYMTLQHTKSGMFLGIQYNGWSNSYDNSPSTNHTKVSCLVKENRNRDLYDKLDWKFNYSKLENHRRYLKSNDTINLSIKTKDDYEFLRSHDIQFTIGNDTFQEVCCHNERLGGNDEWCIELIEQY